jgi:hypothetical protein
LDGPLAPGRGQDPAPGHVPWVGSELSAGLLLNNDVVSRTTVEHIEPRTAMEHIVALITEKGIRSKTANQDVVACAAVGSDVDHARLKS